MIELVVFLLPIAAASGWYTAARRYKSTHTRPNLKPESQSGYFKGINYLLNEQPDKAIDVFVDLLELDHEVIETHLALGSLFRRRGEVEKAIRLHQNLIARPNLDHNLRLDVLRELGLDYMRAGLFDRAEALFQELETHPSHELSAVKRLLEIYQQEREWEQAIEYAKKYAALKKQQDPRLLSHLFCELAIKSNKQQDFKTANMALKKAIAADPNCVRVNLIQADMATTQGDHSSALKHLLAIEPQTVSRMPDVLDQILACFDALEQPEKKFDYLSQLKSSMLGSDATLHLMRLIREREGDVAAVEFLQACLKESPRMEDVESYLQLCAESASTPDASLLAAAMSGLKQDKRQYQCQKCGHLSKEMHWQCTRCQQWGSVEPTEFDNTSPHSTSFSI